ncbi:MAG: hypothetical protein ACM3NH_01540 [Candidatus Saccharibacteria bacterium]
MIDQVFSIYGQFLSYFPANMHWAVSLVLAVLLVVAVYKIVKKNFIYIVLLIVLLPASVPILRNIWESAVNLVRFLLTRR